MLESQKNMMEVMKRKFKRQGMKRERWSQFTVYSIGKKLFSVPYKE